MARFQALTNTVLDYELEGLRQKLGLEPSQRAELLREIASLAAWIVRQADQGRTIEARREQEVEKLSHPAIDRLVARHALPAAESWVLSEAEVERFAAILDRPFQPTPELKALLERLNDPHRAAPKLVRKRAV